MKVDYVHKDTLTATDYVELNKNNELLISYNQALLKENQNLKQIIKMISSGDVPKKVYDKYLSKTPIGFMNYKELCNFFGIGDSDVKD